QFTPMKRYEFFCCTIFYNLSYKKEKQIVSPLFNIRWHLPATIILNKKKKSLRQKDFSANKREIHIWCKSLF
ncbi:hypothetical protein, partial [Streptococcus anginosus]